MILNKNPSRWQVGLILTTGVFAISSAAIFIRLSTEAANLNGVGFSLFLAASRLILASLVLVPTIPMLKEQTISLKGLAYAGAAGLCLATHFATWITSLSFTSIVASTTLVTTNPIWVALIAWFWLKERPSKLTIFGIFLAFLGVVLVVSGDLGASQLGSNPLLGNSLALVGGIMASLYLLLAQEAQEQGINIATYVTVVYSTAAFFLLPLPLFFGTSYFGYPSTVYLYVILMAVISQVIGHTSFNWAVRWISPTLVTLTILFEPIGSSFLGFLFFGEVPAPIVLGGAAVLLIGVATAIYGAKK